MKKIKPKIPAVPLTVWKELYDAAQAFHSMKPWKWLDDFDLIGVRHPVTGETGYGIVMGSGGTLFGFCLYRGAEGLNLYCQLIDETIKINNEELLFLHDCMKLEYCPKSELEPEDKAILQQLSLSFKGKAAWPQLRSYRPGYVPWFLTKEEAELLTIGFRAACFHCEQVADGKVNESLREDSCLVYTPGDESGAPFRAAWELFPLYATKIQLPILDISVLQSLRAPTIQADTAWEAKVVSLPAPLFDAERPYFLRIPILCHASTGIVFSAKPILPDVSVSQALVDVLCAAIQTHRHKPDVLFVSTDEEVEMLQPLARVVGFAVSKREVLSAVEEAHDSFFRYMKAGKI